MHEMSIALAIVEQLEALAAEHEAVRIDELTVRAGALRGIVPDALDLAFEAAATGTRAEGAVLHLEIVPPVARCRVCGARFEPRSDSFLCSGCGKADVELVEGDDIILASVTCEQDGDPGEED